MAKPDDVLQTLEGIDVSTIKDDVLDEFAKAEAPRGQGNNYSPVQKKLEQIIMECERIQDEVSDLEQFLAVD